MNLKKIMSIAILAALILFTALGVAGAVDAGVATDAAVCVGDACASPVTVEVAPDPSIGLIKEIIQAAKAGQWLVVGGLMLIPIIWVARKFGAKFVPWFKTSVGGMVLAFGVSFLTIVGAAFVEGMGFSIGLVGAAFSAGLVAAGGWSGVIKNFKFMNK